MSVEPLMKFKVLGDSRGQLIALEENREIPFDFKRVFYIYGTQEGVPRGQHSHYETQQLLVCVSGSCKVSLDDGKEKKIYVLDRPEIGLYQNKLIWGEMFDFSSDCVLMVLANDFYDEKDYIRDYDTFLKVIQR